MDVLKTRRYRITNWLRVTAIFIAIIVLPLQIFLKSMLQEEENKMIKDWQNNTSQGFKDFSYWVYRLTDTQMTLLSSIFLFLCSDSLIAFKTTLLYCLGQYLIVFLKLLYESPRPFWNDSKIEAMFEYCDIDFASPSQHMFNLSFFWPYVIFMYF